MSELEQCCKEVCELQKVFLQKPTKPRRVDYRKYLLKLKKICDAERNATRPMNFKDNFPEVKEVPEIEEVPEVCPEVEEETERPVIVVKKIVKTPKKVSPKRSKK